MSSEVAANQNSGSDQKSDSNKQQQDQAGSGTDDQKQINGKNIIGKIVELVFLFSFFLLILHYYTTRLIVNQI